MLDQEMLQKIAKKLESLKQETEDRVKELRESDPFRLDTSDSNPAEHASPDDDASLNESHERIRAQIIALRDQLERIDSAQERIANGTYGVCEVCGKEIEASRLSIMPLASMCLEDEKNMEKRVRAH